MALMRCAECGTEQEGDGACLTCHNALLLPVDMDARQAHDTALETLAERLAGTIRKRFKGMPVKDCRRVLELLVEDLWHQPQPVDDDDR